MTQNRHLSYLWESNNIDMVSVSIKNNTLTVKHGAGGRVYTFVNGEKGFKGTDVKRMNTPLKKAYVINGAGINDVIVPKDRPYDVDIAVFKK